MADQDTAVEKIDQRRDDLLRRALATPPLTNEEISRRSSQQPGRLRRKRPSETSACGARRNGEAA